MKLAGRVALISGGGAAGSAARFLAPSLRHAPSGPLRHDAAEEETAFLVSNAGARAIARTCDVAKEPDVRVAAEAAH